jgi:ParB-like chromosome segregation protein Spo0J
MGARREERIVVEKPSSIDPRTKIQIIYRSRSSLEPDSKNPRHHSPRQVKQLTASIRTFGLNVPILIGKNGKVIAGHARLRACEILGIDQVPTICLDHLSPNQARAYMIADNRLTELATWDDQLLAEQLTALASVDLEFDLDVIGFELPEIELRIASLDAPDKVELEPERELPGLPSVPISRAGDLWKLDRHLLLCADALDPASYDHLMRGELADVALQILRITFLLLDTRQGSAAPSILIS